MTLNGTRLTFVGAGNMGEALIRGLLNAELIDSGSITVSDKRPDRLGWMAEKYNIKTAPTNCEAVQGADIVVLAVKPQIFDKVLSDIKDSIPENTLIVSIAAGVGIEIIESLLGGKCRVIRAMPNTPAIVDAGATAISAGTHASEKDLEQAQLIFSAVGYVTVVEENLLDAVTGLSGSGPAYVFMIIEALGDAGVRVGLPRYEAQALAAQTVLGSAKLLIETGEHPGVLKDRVTSPGGTAIAGLHTLEAGGLRTTLINAVVSASERSRELGESFLKNSK